MASSLRLFLAGTGSIVCMTVIYLLIFVNGIITKPLTDFIMAQPYSKGAIGMNMIPTIQWAILALALGGCILCIILAWREVFAEVTYAQEY